MQGLDLPEVQPGLLLPHVRDGQGQAAVVRAGLHEAREQWNLHVHQRFSKTLMCNTFGQTLNKVKYLRLIVI